ncbi:BatD family protein [Marinomonas balearica]|uniref:Oxygen tolerance protein BatD n=1 Tax=Marinomonas balearica TaxID=491947 RepID=A0A4R6MFV1_9GAMM|nr:BatD family protein [Marinomonas balearica]TDO98999.1 oxygen tolerance protein BatD [Marinomonas balearica]
MVVFAHTQFRSTSMYKLKRAITTFFIAFVTLLSVQSWAAGVIASVDKTTVTENQPLKLTLRADFAQTGQGPDLSPLKRDFDVLGKSQNSQFSFNLGTSRALSYWVVNLMPKSVGTFEIPAISIGDHKSNTLVVEVKPAPQLLDQNGNPPVMIRMDVSEISPYVQEQVLINVKIFTSVRLENADISTPTSPDLTVERLLDDQRTYENVNGSSYEVLTRTYLAFPQRSGIVRLPAQSVQAMIATNAGRRMVSVQSTPIDLKVQSIPASYPVDNWLVAKSISIESSLTSSQNTPTVGDTLVWDIEIRAKGALPEQLPPLAYPSTASYKLYPSPNKLDSRKNGEGLEGIETIRIEVVPTLPGQLTLPEIQIPYWNSVSNSYDVAKKRLDPIVVADLASGESTQQIPSQTQTSTLQEQNNQIDNSNNIAPQTQSVAPISLAKHKKNQTDTGAQPAIELTVTEPQKSGFAWAIWAAIGLVILSAGLFFIWFRRSKILANTTGDDVPTLQSFAPLNTNTEEDAYRDLLKCCKQNDLSNLRTNLLEWARHRWGDAEVKGLEDIKRLSNSPKIIQLLMEAELVMYSNQPITHWDGQSLLDALEEYRTGVVKPSQASQLKTLYPNF